MITNYSTGWAASREYAPTRSRVEIIASSVIGGARFQGWYVLGNRVEASNHLRIPQAGNSYFYEARFAH